MAVDNKQIRKDTKHAPDLLEGPDINEDGKLTSSIFCPARLAVFCFFSTI